jgi:tetratricopeptide (TPR) repeat protein
MRERKPQLTLGWTNIVSACLLSLAVQVQAQDLSVDSASSKYDEALDSGLYSEAEVAAKQLIEFAVRDGRHDDISTAQLLVDLARAQRFNGDLEPALQDYEQAVAAIESSSNMFDLALVEPLHGIGITHIENGRADLALPVLERALHVRHVNDGPHSLEQEATLDSLAAAYLQLGKMREAAGVGDTLVPL